MCRDGRHHDRHHSSSRQEHTHGSRSPNARRSIRDQQASADTSASDAAAKVQKLNVAYGPTSVRSAMQYAIIEYMQSPSLIAALHDVTFPLSCLRSSSRAA